MIDFIENIELLEKMVWNFVLNPNADEDLLKPSNSEEYLDKKDLISKIKSKFFTNEDLQVTWKYATLYYTDHGKIPSKKELKIFLGLKNQEIDEIVLDEIYNYNLSEHNYSFLYKYVKAFVLLRGFNILLIDMLTTIKTTNINPENIEQVIESVRNKMNDKLSINFENGRSGLNIMNPQHHIQVSKEGQPTGFTFFDKTQGGGWNPKTLIVFQGRPKVGKSIVLGNVATRAFLAGNNTGVVTVELSESKYMKRLGSNVLGIETSLYDTFTSEEKLGKITQKLDELEKSGKKRGELLIKEFATGSATAIDVENYFIRQEKEMNKKFHVIVVDYINLMRPITEQGGLYEKIKVISEELRGVAMRNEWCIITATQIKRDAIDDFDLGMDSVAESFGLIHTVDALYGLMRGPLEQRMKIKLIANRDNGYEESYKFFDMKKDYMRLDESIGENSEYYSDDEDVGKMETELRDSYKSINSNDSFGLDGNNQTMNIQNDDYTSLLNDI
jgi:predicted ATP-dependent serine protease